MSWQSRFHRLVTILAGPFLVAVVLISARSLQATEAPDPASMPAALLMVDDAGCIYCRKWDREIAPAYENSDEGQLAPLLRRAIRSAAVARYPGVRYTPTFLLLVEGREVGRIVGYAGPDFFWGELEQLMQKSGLRNRKPKGIEDIRTDIRPETGLRRSAAWQQ